VFFLLGIMEKGGVGMASGQMWGFWDRKSIRSRVYRPVLLLLLVFGVSFVILINLAMKRIAYREAFQLSQVLVSQNLAVHSFVNEELKPSFFRNTTLTGDDFFPELMSSTYMIRRINSYQDPYVPVSYYYKEVAVNARSPQNEAKDYEIELLQRFASGELQEHREVRNYGNERFFVYMRAGEVMEENCLSCHGNPMAAPDNLVAQYGRERSFHRQPGELISALSVRIPLQDAYAGANRTSAYLSLSYLAMMLLLSGSVSAVVNRNVIRPVGRLNRRIRETLGRYDQDGRDMQLAGDELENVDSFFTYLEARLAEAYNSLEQLQALEEKVRQRTQELEATNGQLMMACQNDWLLGIFNRGTFEERAKAEFDRMRREKKPISFLMVDLDNFKQYNDTYGHQAGDMVLKTVADVIRQQIRSYDLLGRYGGEELAVCLPATDLDEAVLVAERIVHAVYAAGIYHRGNPPHEKVTVSVGVASSTDVSESYYEKMINEADDHMYSAKRSGKNTHYPKE
jgi:diguanylate cyclase (GGDEF)-like protein